MPCHKYTVVRPSIATDRRHPIKLASGENRDNERNRVECETAHIREGNSLAIQLGGPAVTVAEVSTGQTVTGTAVTGIMLEILESGGLVPYLRRAGQFHV